MIQTRLGHCIGLMQGEEKDADYCLKGYAPIWKHEGNRVAQQGLQLAGEAQQSYFKQVIELWAKIDLCNLFRSLDKLPFKEIRSRAAMMLARDHLRQQTLSDAELENVMSYLDKDDAERQKERMRDLEKQS